MRLKARRCMLSREKSGGMSGGVLGAPLIMSENNASAGENTVYSTSYNERKYMSLI